MVANRADAAQALHNYRQFPVGPALNEFFETAKLNDVQASLTDMVFLVHQQRHLAVPLDPTQRIDGNPT